MKNLLLLTLLAIQLNSLAQVPQLSSSGSATSMPTLFIDFDGQFVMNPFVFNQPLQLTAPALTTQQMTEIFQRVAEDFAIFNINVTTDSTRYWAAPVRQRIRVIVTPNSSWYTNTYGGAGGVAIFNTFFRGDDTPAFVFADQLQFGAKYIAEAVSHETGHTMGLFHQSVYDGNCQLNQVYNPGVGDGEEGWAPIMGVSYFKNQTTWHIGPTDMTGCTSLQNDIAIITKASGANVALRTDAEPNVATSATELKAASRSGEFSSNGFINSNSDVDAFSFSIKQAGNYKLSAIPAGISNSVGSNVNLRMTLLDGNNRTLATIGPLDTLKASGTLHLATGTYKVLIAADAGRYYNGTGNIGSYAFFAGPALGGTVLPVKNIKLTGSANKGDARLQWQIEADEVLVKQTLEISTDGRHFEADYQASTNTRQWQRRLEKAAYFRLKASFDNGQHYFSNVVALQPNDYNKLQSGLVGNFSQNNTLHVEVKDAPIEFEIITSQGQSLQKGNLTVGRQQVYLRQPKTGWYVMRFNQNGVQWSEKFMIP